METRIDEGFVPGIEGGNLYYISRGEGLPLIFCNGIGVSTASYWPPVCIPLSTRYRTVGWDYPGHGRSDLPASSQNLSMEACAQNLACLLDGLEIEQAIVAGHSMGVQVILEFYRHFPERCLGLIPTLGTFRHPFNTFANFRYSRHLLQAMTHFLLRFPQSGGWVWRNALKNPLADPVSRVMGMVHSTLCSSEELERYRSHLSSVSPWVFSHMATFMQEHSADDVLETITVPTLIFAGEYDLFTPLELSKEMHQRIRGSELQLIKHGSHAAIAEQPDLFRYRIEIFLQDHFPLSTTNNPKDTHADQPPPPTSTPLQTSSGDVAARTDQKPGPLPTASTTQAQDPTDTKDPTQKTSSTSSDSSPPNGKSQQQGQP